MTKPKRNLLISLIILVIFTSISIYIFKYKQKDVVFHVNVPLKINPYYACNYLDIEEHDFIKLYLPGDSFYITNIINTEKINEIFIVVYYHKDIIMGGVIPDSIYYNMNFEGYKTLTFISKKKKCLIQNL